MLPARKLLFFFSFRVTACACTSTSDNNNKYSAAIFVTKARVVNCVWLGFDDLFPMNSIQMYTPRAFRISWRERGEPSVLPREKQNNFVPGLGFPVTFSFFFPPENQGRKFWSCTPQWGQMFSLEYLVM